MYLKRVEIHGFKSFAKKTVLEFEPGIISVVGPNGSGKSNIADSLRWVFGEQSMKLLRGKKSEDVIFAGSDQKARLGGAEVSVSFDNTDHQIPIDYAEVVITRRLFRDGNSEYLINHNQVRLLDIQEILAKSDFGNTSYHVIGQGTIDQLVAGGPAAIKELLEEASGVKPYYHKRERTLRRLERTESNVVQVRALISEIEPRLRSLRRQTKRLAEREGLEQELRNAQALHYAQILRGLAQQIQEISGKFNVFDKQTQDLSTEIRELTSSIEQHELETKGSAASEQKKLKADLEAWHKQKLDLQEQLATIKGQMKAEALHPSIDVHPDWSVIRVKFRSAYQKFLGLLKNFNLEDAKTVEKLFTEVAGLIEADEGGNDRNKPRTLQDLEIQEKRLNEGLQQLFAKIQALETDLAKFVQQEEQKKQQIFVKDRLLRNKQETLVKTSEQKNLLAVEQAKLVTRKEAYEQEGRAELGHKFQELVTQVPGGSMPAGLTEKIASLKKQLQMIGGVDDLVIQEYKETDERYQYLTTQSADLDKGIKDLKTAIAELDEVIKKEFHEAFTKISEKFAEYFRILFNGGRATMSILRERPRTEFEESDAEDVESEKKELKEFPSTTGKTEIVGIEIKATPPGKKLAGISALSGGERALTSIALLCAILATYPSPFVVLDEVDAALDEANSIRFGKILGTLAHRTQFITITHNRETMRQSHTLYGITMGEDGISKLLSLKLEQAAVYSTKN
jgi:chromosome segregation ATPase